MELSGKKINFLGDSITEGCCASSFQLGYTEVLKKTALLAEARNYGIGGTRIARQHTASQEEKYDLDFCGRIGMMDPDADIVIVFGGTNDHGHGDAPMGSPTDRTPETFIGACHYLWTALLAKYPGKTIVALTPLHRVGENTPKEDGGWILKDYASVIRNTAISYDIPVLDLFETSAIRADIPCISQKLTTDGLHPNDEGHAILASEIKAFLEQL